MAAPPMAHHLPPLPASFGVQQAEELRQKVKSLLENGTPRTDPEVMKGTQLLHSFIQHQNRQAQAAQNAAVAANGAANGTQQPRHSQSDRSQPVINTAIPPNSVSAPTESPSADGYSDHLTHEQIQLLRSQVFAFRALRENNRIPARVQATIFGIRERREMMKRGIPPASSGSLANGVDPNEIVPGVPKHAYKAIQASFFERHRHPISYWDHSHRPRVTGFVPGFIPEGVDFDDIHEAIREREQKQYEDEVALYRRMSDRYEKLKSLPGNLSHWDAAQEEPKLDDSQRLKAIIQLKKLGLYSKQKELRKNIATHMMSFDNLATTLNRSAHRRHKKLNVREARITEKLEKQQRDARETREKKKHTDFLQALHRHQNDMAQLAAARGRKAKKLRDAVNLQHSNIEKEEQKRIERTAKQRLQALKANDEEAYLALLDEAKDTRITHLLRQTDGFLKQLASSVREQQRASDHDGPASPLPEVESEDEDDPGKSRIDYYAVAHRVKEEVTQQADILVGGTLKEYQVKGLQWMLSLYNNNLNGILADEMGLGKTIQTISLVTYLIEKKKQNGPYLVIVPLSTLTNWSLEFDKWAPSVNKVVYKGPPTARKLQQEKIRQGFQVLLTTFEYIIKDRPLLSRIKWFHMIIDEGHRMKNSNSKLSATIQQYYQTRFRLILTGTPLQNNLQELWSMLNFVLPNIFNSLKTFDEWFNTPFANTGDAKIDLTEEEKILVIRRLHKVLRPFLLRRLKRDVEKDLPDKTEKVIKCKFSALQTKLYKQMVTHSKIVVSDGKGGKSNARGLSNMIMQLRKLCNHPFVFEAVENQMNPLSVSNDLLWRTAGKFELLDRILPKYKATGHRVLMFFQMTAIMDIMEDYLRYRNYQFLRLDGMTKSDERAEMLRLYNAPDSEYFLFLLSTRAGGLGLNLQTADTVIIYDSDWNPHQDLQAQDRAHRIGQKNEVRILRLVSSNSVEEKILERARYKLDLDGKVIQAGKFDNKSSETDRDTMLRTLLESADMTESGDQDDMDDEELNMLLARSDDEVVVFQRLDEERQADPVYGTNPGCRGKPRLMVDDELPDIYLDESNPVPEEVEETLGRGARERTKVRYDDGLTEEQWLNAVDDDEDSPEAAAARKQARKDKRDANRGRRVTIAESQDKSPGPSRASTEEVEATPKKRGRKPGSKNLDKRKADEADEEPPAKKRRGPQGRPRAMPTSRVSPRQRDVLQKSLRALYDAMMTYEVDDIEPLSDGDSDPGTRLIIGPFVKLPPKRDFPDYYIIIREPIAMKQIEAKIKKEEYDSLGDIKRDMDLMITNCRTYNEDGSILYQDSKVMEEIFNAKLQEMLGQHPELGELESLGDSKDASQVALDGASQPSSSGSGTRIRIVSSVSKEANGSVGLGSDGED